MTFDAPLSRCPSCLSTRDGEGACPCGYGTPPPRPQAVVRDIWDYVRDGGRIDSVAWRRWQA